jgi:hypothetical protein
VSWSDTHTQALAGGASITLSANGGPSDLATWTATSGSHQVQAFVDDVGSDPREQRGQQTHASPQRGRSCSPNYPGRPAARRLRRQLRDLRLTLSCDARASASRVPLFRPLEREPPRGCPQRRRFRSWKSGWFDTGTLATNEIWDNFDGASGSNRLAAVGPDTTNQHANTTRRALSSTPPGTLCSKRFKAGAPSIRAGSAAERNST